MHYYIYEIKNNINHKIYVGVHKTNQLDDGYMGSGKVIKAAIEKYGKENFTKIILETFDSSHEMYSREKELVNAEFLLREDTYNLRRGGTGGFDYINNSGLGMVGSLNSVIVQKEMRTYDVDWCKNKAKKLSISNKGNPRGAFSDEGRLEMVNRAKQPISIEKRKYTFSEICHQQGEKNSSYGTMWITNGILNRKIIKSDIIPDGWCKGRVMRRLVE